MNEPPVPSPTRQRPSIGVGVVVLRPIQDSWEVLLVRRGRPPRQGEWSIPGGRQEWGEGVRETAAREVMEETGVSIASLRLVDVVDGIGRTADGSAQSHWTLVDFRADWAAGEPRAGDDAAEVQWVALADLHRHALWSETQRIIMAAASLA